MAQGNQIVTISNPASHGVVGVSYNPATHTLTFNHQDGSVDNFVLNDKYVQNAHLSGNELILTREDGSEYKVDLTNVGQHTMSGIVDSATGIVAFTRNDGSTWTLNLSTLPGKVTKLQKSGHELIYTDELGGTTAIDIEDYDKHVTQGNFNNGTNLLRFAYSDGSTFDVNLTDLRETVTSIRESGDILIYKDENGVDTDIDLSRFDHTSINYVKTSTKGQADGVASLDGSGLVPAAQLPSYVDDVLEFPNLAAFPATGEPHKIYVAIDTHKTYRWTGSSYAQLNAGLVLGTTTGTAFEGDKGQVAYLHSSATGNPHGTAIADITNLQTQLDARVLHTQVKSLVTAANKVVTQDDITALVGSGIGDMLKSVYDTNSSGKVDLAEDSELVNGKTVLTSVPAGAEFTDTQADWDETTLASKAYIANKPDLTTLDGGAF